MSFPKKTPAAFNDYILSGSQPPLVDRSSAPVAIPSTVKKQHISECPQSAGSKRRSCERTARHSKKKNVGTLSLRLREAPQMYRPGELRTVMQPHLFDAHDESNMIAHMIGGGHGFRLRPLQKIMQTLPGHLRDALIHTMSAMKLVMMNKALFAQMNEPKSKMLRHLVSRLPARKANRIVMPDEVRKPSMPEQLPGTTTTMLPFYVRVVDDDYSDDPYICEVRDLTSFRRVGMCFNRKMCEVFGMSCEEMFSRIANSEFEMTDLSSELEVINCAVQTYISMMDKDSPEYRTIILSKDPCWRSHMDKDGAIKRHYGHTEIDGNFLYRHIWKVHSTAEEYDRTVEEEPEACRPLLRAAGDLRTGRELEEGHRLDRRILLEDMNSTAQGAQFLQAYSDAIRRRVDPIMRAAALGIPMHDPSSRRPADPLPASPPSFGSTPTASEVGTPEESQCYEENSDVKSTSPAMPTKLGSDTRSGEGMQAETHQYQGLESCIQTDFQSEIEEWTDLFSFSEPSTSEKEEDESIDTLLQREWSKGSVGQRISDCGFRLDVDERNWPLF